MNEIRNKVSGEAEQKVKGDLVSKGDIQIAADELKLSLLTARIPLSGLLTVSGRMID